MARPEASFVSIMSITPDKWQSLPASPNCRTISLLIDPEELCPKWVHRIPHWIYMSQPSVNGLLATYMFTKYCNVETCISTRKYQLICFKLEEMFHRTRVANSQQPNVDKGLNPVRTKHLYSIYTMLDQCRRRWADVV